MGRRPAVGGSSTASSTLRTAKRLSIGTLCGEGQRQPEVTTLRMMTRPSTGVAYHNWLAWEVSAWAPAHRAAPTRLPQALNPNATPARPTSGTQPLSQRKSPASHLWWPRPLHAFFEDALHDAWHDSSLQVAQSLCHGRIESIQVLSSHSGGVGRVEPGGDVGHVETGGDSSNTTWAQAAKCGRVGADRLSNHPHVLGRRCAKLYLFEHALDPQKHTIAPFVQPSGDAKHDRATTCQPMSLCRSSIMTLFRQESPSRPTLGGQLCTKTKQTARTTASKGYPETPCDVAQPRCLMDDTHREGTMISRWHLTTAKCSMRNLRHTSRGLTTSIGEGLAYCRMGPWRSRRISRSSPLYTPM